jgi:poly(3-hydroxybutyrate) depolymerase
MMAVCQPSVPAFAATALLNLHKSPATPATLTMMGGPIDTRECPTLVNNMAMQRPIEWFRQSVIATVPIKYPGAGRRVYPGFMQLNAFMSMNLSSHMMSHYEMFKHLTAGDDASAQATKDFYDEYRSVCDMTAEFYLQTVEEVFQKHSIPKGEFRHKVPSSCQLAVAAIGFMMLTGRMNWRFGATVIIGVFILFGATTIVAGIQSAAG